MHVLLTLFSLSFSLVTNLLEPILLRKLATVLSDGLQLEALSWLDISYEICFVENRVNHRWESRETTTSHDGWEAVSITSDVGYYVEASPRDLGSGIGHAAEWRLPQDARHRTDSPVISWSKFQGARAFLELTIHNAVQRATPLVVHAAEAGLVVQPLHHTLVHRYVGQALLAYFRKLRDD